MKKNVLLALAACSPMLFTAFGASAQDESVMVVDESVSFTEIPCKTNYYTTKGENWFIQIGAGIDAPFVEDSHFNKSEQKRLTVNYNVGFGKWFSPYFGWRMSFNGGPMHWTATDFTGGPDVTGKAKFVNGNVDIMWDMFNSMHGVNAKRVFSIVPFIGVGATYMWDFKTPDRYKPTQWMFPASAGLQLRFRMCRYVDFFLEGRIAAYGDNFNQRTVGRSIDLNVTGVGGFSFNLGGAGFRSYNPCDYTGYIANLNNQVNDLRAALATTTAALAVAESQLPCPEIEVQETNAVVVAEPTPLMATVRFRINSARIQPEEMVNVYNIAQWMQQNPDQNVSIVGYADKDTGTSAYNMQLSQRRAKAVNDMLVNKYGINPDRLSIKACGSDSQPYDVNNWNRIVIFNVAE